MTNIDALALCISCRDGDAAAVSRLLPAPAACAQLNLSGPRFWGPSGDIMNSPLIYAAEGGHTELVRMMLALAPDTDVDYMNANGRTALSAAAEYRHAGTVQLLAELGANLNAADQRGGTQLRFRGTTPLRFAVSGTNPDARPRDPDPDGTRLLSTVQALLRLGAVIDPVDSVGFTPLCIACERGDADVVIALLEGGANVDFVTPASDMDYPGFTPLMFAVHRNRAGVVQMLIERGADGTKTTTDEALGVLDVGSTALDIARVAAANNPGRAESFAVLRRRCCGRCGMTSAGLSATTPGRERHLKRCARCPARCSSAWYCGPECQRAEGVVRHRGECDEARRARQPAITEV